MLVKDFLKMSDFNSDENSFEVDYRGKREYNLTIADTFNKYGYKEITYFAFNAYAFYEGYSGLNIELEVK